VQSQSGVANVESSQPELSLNRATLVRVLGALLDESPESLPIRADYFRQCEDLTGKLAGPGANPVEQLLSEVVAMNFVVSRLLTRQFALALQSGASLAMGSMLQQSISRAEKRLCNAVDTLNRSRGIDVRLTVATPPMTKSG
jgi:hypothetical protein